MSVQLERERRVAARAGARGAVAQRAPVNFERLRAPFSLRCGALLIDYIIVVGVLALATLAARVFGDDTRRGSSFILFVGYLTTAGVAFVNFVLLANLSGRTMGKWVAGLRIERRDGEALSVRRALLRHLVGYPLTILTLGFGFLVAAFDPQGRALHDWLAGTVVVRSRAPRAAARSLK
ncbi:MAG: RDD family protein [Pyrinomonadaceae bacterium]